jgi:hypothetical protein
MEAIRQLVIRILAKSNKSGIVTTLPKKDLVDFQSMILAEKFMQNGVDPNALKSADQAFNILKQIDQAETNRIRNLDVSSGKVFDMEGNEIPPGSKIMGGKEVKGTSDRDRVRNEMKTKYGFTDERLNEIENTPIDEEMADRLIAETDLPPLGSRGDKDDIAAPFQSQEETLRNMTEAEIKANLEAQNKATIKKIKERKRPDVYTIDDYDTTNMSDIKKEIIRTETKLGNLNPNSPDFRERANVLINKIEDLKSKMRDDKAAGGRAGYKFGIGPLIELLTKASKTSPLQFGKNYMKNIKEKTLRANETGKFMDLPIVEAGLPAATGAFITNQVKKRLQSMNEEERQKNKDEMFKEISQEYKERYKDDPEFLEKMLLSLHENIYMDKKADGGRIGYKDGPKLSDFIDIQAEGSKTGKQQIQGAPEGFTIDKETFNAILKADIPLSEKIDFLASYQYGKGRDRIEKDNQEIFLGEGGFKDRNVGFGFNKDGEGIGGTLMYNLETGKPQFNIGFKKRFEDGGRAGYKFGIGPLIELLTTKGEGGSLKKFLERRNFLKTIVGNSPEAENKRTLEKLIEERREFKKFLDKNPPVKFPGPGDKEYDDYILRLNQIMAKDRLKSATGGRIGYKLGSLDKGRRAFLKMLGIGAGTAGAIKSGILGFSKTPPTKKIIEKVPFESSTRSVPPPYFFELAEKIKKLGKPDKVTYQERVEITRYTGKNGDEYELIEDLTTGDMQITKDKMGVGTYGDKSFDTIQDRTVLEFKKGDADVDVETQRGYRSADEYEEYKVEFDSDGTEAGAEAMDEIVQKEIIEEATGDAPSIKKASGGIARMLGE